VWKRKKNCKGSITTDQMIVNVLKNIEHENHPPSPAQDVEVTKVMLSMNTKAQDNFDTPSRLRSRNVQFIKRSNDFINRRKIGQKITMKNSK